MREVSTLKLTAIILATVLLVIFGIWAFVVTEEDKPGCPGVWKPVCEEFDTNLGTNFASEEDAQEKAVCCVEKLCQGVWRDVVVCTSSAHGTSIGRSFSDSINPLNDGKVCCSQ